MLGVFLPWSCLSAFLVFFGLILDIYILSLQCPLVCVGVFGGRKANVSAGPCQRGDELSRRKFVSSMLLSWDLRLMIDDTFRLSDMCEVRDMCASNPSLTPLTPTEACTLLRWLSGYLCHYSLIFVFRFVLIALVNLMFLSCSRSKISISI